MVSRPLRGSHATGSRSRPTGTPDPPRERRQRNAPAWEGGESTAGGDRLFIATLRLKIPPDLWPGKFTNAHPQVRLEALNWGDLGEGQSVSDYWISGGTPGVWAKEISTFPDVRRVESLAQVGEGCLYRITYRNPPIIGLYRRLQLPVPIPIRMQAGMIDWEIVARYSEFEMIMDYVRSRDPDARIISVRRRPLRTHVPALSDRQQRLLAEAMAAGYFAVPRGITLTELARKLNRSKSSISESIAVIEQKLLEIAMRPPMPA